MPGAAGSVRRVRPRTVLLGLLGVTVVVSLLAGGLATMAWGDSLREQERLLPGTTIAGVDVGDRTVDEARAAVGVALDEDLDREIEVTHGERGWTTTPRRLGATTDADEVLAAAFEQTTRAGLVELARLRVGAGDVSSHDVTLDVPDAQVAGLVAGIADQVDATRRNATVTWVDGGVDLEDAVIGQQVRQEEAMAAVQAAIAEGTETVSLPVDERDPPFGTEQAQQVADEVAAVVDAALDHRVTITLEGSSRTLAPRDLGAEHNGPALLAARGATPDDVELRIPDAAVDEVVDQLAAEHEQPAHNAHLDWSAANGFLPTPGSTGLALDREEARDAVQAALQGVSDRVDLELDTTQPRITTDSFDEVLLVRHPERRVELYRGGQVVRSWDVAVGQPEYATPTGMFTIGAKRFEPTWHNSSPDGWGSDMPAVIGPGPDNPLGLRALNWEQSGHDTLIRFHGTANVNSIGRAASHGCVRMLNRDVIELFDLVETGTVIVSVDA